MTTQDLSNRTQFDKKARDTMKKLFITLLAIAALILMGAPANATGSDGVPPYDVGQAGITLPQGEVFKPHGHVNIKYTDFEGAGEQSAGIHFDPNNNQPGGAWIGESFIPWTAFGLTDDFCITWVQIHGFNQHYGEGPHKTMCIPPVDPCVDDPHAPGCEIPPAPETWHDVQERTNPLVCEPDATGFGIITTEAREGTRTPEWIATEWRWVTPTEWTWTDWVLTGEERVESEACDPLVEVGSTLPPAYVAGAGVLIAGGAAMLLLGRKRQEA